jgi:hypothetical protein
VQLAHLILALAAPLATPDPDEDPCSFADHLEVEAAVFTNGLGAYDYALGRALLRGFDRELQMVVSPSFGREEAVYVQRAGGTHRVVAVRLRSRLADVLNRVLAEHDRDERPRTERAWAEMDREVSRALFCGDLPPADVSTAPISEHAVARLKALWRAALGRTHGRESCTPTPGKPWIAATDGTGFHFAARDDFGTQTWAGRTNDGHAGPKILELIAIGRQLARYARASALERPSLESALVSKADALAARFAAEPERPRPDAAR